MYFRNMHINTLIAESDNREKSAGEEMESKKKVKDNYSSSIKQTCIF